MAIAVALAAVAAGAAGARVALNMCTVSGATTAAVVKAYGPLRNAGEVGSPSDSPLGQSCLFQTSKVTIEITLYPKSEAATETTTLTTSWVQSLGMKKHSLAGYGPGAALYVSKRSDYVLFISRKYLVTINGGGIAPAPGITSTGEHELIGIARLVHAKLG